MVRKTCLFSAVFVFLFQTGLSSVDIFNFVDTLLSEKFCSQFRFQCLPIEKCENGYLEESGCCPMCLHYLEKGELCNVPLPAPGGPVRRCRPQLKCLNGLCTEVKDEDSESCLAKRERRLALLKCGKILDEAWIPQCDKRTGGYLPKQCKGKKCVCVDEKGRTIFGQAEVELSANMTCECSTRMNRRKREDSSSWMSAAQIHCTDTGDYDALQCEGDICYCADPKTGKPTGAAAPLQQWKLLSCYDEELHGEGPFYSRDCEQEEIRNKALAREFEEKGITLEGIETAACELDGNFARRQCGNAEKCVCSTPKGVQFGTYAHAYKELALAGEMDCNCAYDEYRNQKFRFTKLNCNGAGGYDPFACVGHKCYCIERDGALFREVDKPPGITDVKDEIEKLMEECLQTDQSLTC